MGITKYIVKVDGAPTKILDLSDIKAGLSAGAHTITAEAWNGATLVSTQTKNITIASAQQVAAPTNLRFDTITSDSFKIHFDYPLTSENRYYYEISLQSDFSTIIWSIDLPGKSVTVTTREAYTLYYVRVQAKRSDGSMADSEWVTGQVTTLVAAPTITTATVENVNSDKLVVVFSEVVNITDVTGLTITGDVTPTLSAPTGTGTNTITFTLSAALTTGQSVTLNVAGTNTIEDTANNALAVTTRAVTNNAAAAGIEYVVWEQFVNATSSGSGNLRSTSAGSSYVNGAYAVRAINGDNAVSFKGEIGAVSTDVGGGVGLTNAYAGISSGNQADLDIWVQFRKDVDDFRVFENGSVMTTAATYLSTDVLTLRVVGTTVTIELNGTTVYTSGQVYTLPLTPIGLVAGAITAEILDTQFESNANLITSPL